MCIILNGLHKLTLIVTLTASVFDKTRCGLSYQDLSQGCKYFYTTRVFQDSAYECDTRCIWRIRVREWLVHVYKYTTNDGIQIEHIFYTIG